MSALTGLSQAQVYKWWWDQKKKISRYEKQAMNRIHDKKKTKKVYNKLFSE